MGRIRTLAARVDRAVRVRRRDRERVGAVRGEASGRQGDVHPGVVHDRPDRARLSSERGLVVPGDRRLDPIGRHGVDASANGAWVGGEQPQLRGGHGRGQADDAESDVRAVLRGRRPDLELVDLPVVLRGRRRRDVSVGDRREGTRGGERGSGVAERRAPTDQHHDRDDGRYKALRSERLGPRCSRLVLGQSRFPLLPATGTVARSHDEDVVRAHTASGGGPPEARRIEGGWR